MQDNEHKNTIKVLNSQGDVIKEIERKGGPTIAEYQQLTPVERAAYLAENEDMQKAIDAAEAMRTALTADISEAFNKATEHILELINTEEMQELIKAAEEVEKAIYPAIVSILSAPENAEKYQGITPEEVLNNLDVAGRIINPDLITAEILLKTGLIGGVIEGEEYKEKAIISRRAPLPAIRNAAFLNDNANHALLKQPAEESIINDAITRLYRVNQGNVNTAVTMIYRGENVELSKPSNLYDNALEGAISSICLELEKQNGGRFMPFSVTADELWRIMVGNQDKHKKPTEKQRQEVIDAINKGRFTDVIINASKEFKKHNIEIEGEKAIDGKISANRFNCTRIQVKTEKGRIIEAYRFNEEPILLTYNKAKASDNNPHGHIIFLPLEVLNVEDTEANTIAILNYLLSQLIYMYHSPVRNTVIRYETMYQNGVEPPEARVTRENITRSYKSKADIKTDATYQANIRKTRANDRKRVKRILDHWKKIQLIKGYKELTEGRAIVGVRIMLNPNAPQLNAEN